MKRSRHRMRACLLAGILTVFALSAGAAGSEPITPADAIRLFNGTNLAGFHSWLVDTKHADPRQVFTVTNGLLRISGEGLGYLATAAAYRDYHLVAEFRWGKTNWTWGDRIGKARDSGIFLHATGPDGNSHDGSGAFMAAIECQVMEGCIGDILLIRGTARDGSLIAPRVTVQTTDHPDNEGWPYWDPAGTARTLSRWGRINRLQKSRPWRDEFGTRDSSGLESPAGEWNRLECRCSGGSVSIRLNGRLVNEARDVFPGQGRILLQCEGSEIFFRRVELLPALKPGNPPAQADQ